MKYKYTVENIAPKGDKYRIVVRLPDSDTWPTGKFELLFDSVPTDSEVKAELINVINTIKAEREEAKAKHDEQKAIKAAFDKQKADLWKAKKFKDTGEVDL